MSLTNATCGSASCELAQQNLPLQRMDARVKIILVFIFILTVMSFPRYAVSAILPMLFFPITCFALGGIPFLKLYKPLLAAAPFAVLVGLANPIMDRAPMELGFGFALASGWISFTSILLRFMLTASALFALNASTGIRNLCGSLAWFGVPRILTTQLWMMHRYSFVITGEVRRMLRSIEARSGNVRRLKPVLYTRLTGALLLRVLARADRIHLAMLSRGFDGRFNLCDVPGLRISDLFFAAAWLAFFISARTWNLADALGRIITGSIA